MTGILVDHPGISIVAVDPGGTTGIAIWDAWDQKLYVDQIDVSRGRRVRQRVWPGVIESARRRKNERGIAATWGIRDQQVQAGRGLKAGKAGERAVLDACEREVAHLLVDICAAAGPKTYVVMEDFILGAHQGGASGKREGLSPVRIAARFEHEADMLGLWTGDLWRQWTGHGWAGADLRGWRVEDGEVPGLRGRLRQWRAWRDGGDPLNGDEREGVVWGGGGCRYVTQLGAERCYLKGGEAAMKEMIRGRGMWMPGAPHGMDALMHMMAFGRKIGADIQADPERLWRITKENPPK